CALALAMPAALSAATANLRKRGFLVARGHVIETLNSVNRVIFDKTGTLTKGQFTLADVQLLAGASPSTPLARDQLLGIAAALEVGSNHPLARAFSAWQDIFKASDVKQITAAGVEGQIDGVVYRLGTLAFASEFCSATSSGPLSLPDNRHLWLLLADQYQPLAWIGLADEVRPDAAALITSLKQRGI